MTAKVGAAAAFGVLAMRSPIGRTFAGPPTPGESIVAALASPIAGSGSDLSDGCAASWSEPVEATSGAGTICSGELVAVAR